MRGEQRVWHVEQLSNRLGHFPQLLCTSFGILEFPPIDRKHLISPFARGQDHTQLISRGTEIITLLVSQTDHHSSYDISHPETLGDLDLVDLRRANVLLPDQRGEGVSANVLASRAKCHYRNGCLSRVRARDLAENYASDFREESAYDSVDRESWQFGRFG